MISLKIQLVLVLFCALLQIYEGLSFGAEAERGLSNQWQRGVMGMGLLDTVDNLMKRSKALRFYGLMGKRSVTKKPFEVNRRNKAGMFVGLMGRSLSDKESMIRAPPSEIGAAEKAYKHGSPEEWVQILD